MSNEHSALHDAMVEISEQEPGEYMAGAQQLDLLRGEDGKLPPDALRQARQNGAGRPKGARNKRTQDLAKHFLAKYGDPLGAIAEIAFMPVDVLHEQMVLAQGGKQYAKKLITGKDAMQLKLTALEDCVPYVHGKQPLQVDIKGRPDVVVFMPGVNAPDGDADVLQDAVEKLGIDAIRESGLELMDGRTIPESEIQNANYEEIDGEEDGDE